MTVDNQELMMELQRVAVQLRRSRRARMKGRDLDKQGNERVHDGSDPKRPHRGDHGHRTHGADDPRYNGEATHSYGNHRCHGGSGRHGQHRILAVLMMQDGTSQKDLAYLLGIRPQSLTQALESLEAEGYITRQQDADDKRARLVHLTDEGRAYATQVAEERRNYADDTFSMLTDDEKDQLAAILAKIAAALDAEITHKE